MISIGACKLGEIPRVVAIIDRPQPKAVIKKCVTQGVDLFEIRFDCFKGPFEDTLHYVRLVKQWTKLPLIGTNRETSRNKVARFEQFKQVVNLVHCIDIEIDTPIRDQVIALASKKCVVMVSEHDFKTMPTEKRLEQIVAQSVKAGARIVKIAAAAKTSGEVVCLLEFTRRTKQPLVTIAMGEVGSISRLVAPLFGSLFTYGYITASVAPGQVPVFTLLDDVRRYYPRTKTI